ncbi:hypothetical protein AERO9AM_20276 [Aeromicrobium sp. 9AM]|nr:hypothetical protein AERO9AM_20276 [Aeromicrobium sp. 9AM]
MVSWMARTSTSLRSSQPVTRSMRLRMELTFQVAIRTRRTYSLRLNGSKRRCLLTIQHAMNNNSSNVELLTRRTPCPPPTSGAGPAFVRARSSPSSRSP